MKRAAEYDKEKLAEAKKPAAKKAKLEKVDLGEQNDAFDAELDAMFFNPDFDVEETSLTSGARYSLIKHEEWIKGLTHEAVYTAISNRIDSGIRNGDIRVSSEDDKLKIAIAARTFFAEYSNKIIRLSDGRNLYFAPDPQDIKRGLSKQEAWANYCIHAVTHGGDTVKGRGYPERIFSEEKVDSLMLIEGIVRDENCYAHLNPKHRDKDGVVFVGKDAKGNRMDVVARLDEYGDISADLTEVTAIMKGGKMPPLENIKPLTEVVKEVAIHQAEGYSHLTHNANIIAQSGTESQGDNVQKQTALSGGTSRNQNPAGNELAKKLGIFKPGTRNVDIGAGRFDKATNFLKELGVTNIPFDPVNRSSEENKRNAEAVRKNRAETATVHNVLNVIDNDAVMEGIINQAARAIKPNGTAIFTVYEGDGSGNPKATRDGYQRNAKTAEYIPAIKKYFAKVETRGKVILGKAPKDKGPAFWSFDSNFDNGIRFFNPDMDVEEGSTPKNLRKIINKSNRTESAKKEMLSILKTYTNRDGSYKRGYLKAPNGKDSNLNPIQWLEVCTSAFRSNFFGDWLSLLRKQLLDNANVSNVRVGAFVRDAGLSVQASTKKYVNGIVEHETDIGKVTIDDDSIHDSLGHNYGPS